jgi:sulfate-transporting ATPase
VAGVKFYAFGLAAVLVSLAGVLSAFRFTTVQYSGFGLDSSLNVVMLVTIGGIGYLGGAFVAGAVAVSGFLAYFTQHFGNSQSWWLLISGALLVVTLVANPAGVAHTLNAALSRVIGRFGRSRADLPSVESRRPAVAKALELDNIVVTFGGVRAVNGVSLTVRPGRVSGLIGSNGAGKTTVIDVLSGYCAPDTGVVRLGGKDVTSASAAARARAGVGRTFQNVELFDQLTVRETLLLAAEQMPRSAWLTDLLHRRRKGIPADVLALTNRLGLEEDLDHLPEQIPYGRRRQLDVVRALAALPSVLLLDEPAAGLNDQERAVFVKLVRSIAEERGIGILLVEHHVDMVAELCDDVVVMERGGVIFAGAPGEALSDSAVVAAYLGSREEQVASVE